MDTNIYLNQFATFKPHKMGCFRTGRLNHTATKKKIAQHVVTRFETLEKIKGQLDRSGETTDHKIPDNEVAVRFKKQLHTVSIESNPFGLLTTSLVINGSRVSMDKASEYFDIPTWLRILKLLEKLRSRISQWKPKDECDFREAKRIIFNYTKGLGTMGVGNPNEFEKTFQDALALATREETEEAFAIAQTETKAHPLRWLNNERLTQKVQRRIIVILAEKIKKRDGKWVDAPKQTEDPLEAEIKAALEARGVAFFTEDQPENLAKMDFFLPEQNLYIEVKGGHTPRITNQMAKHHNVIAVQGSQATKWFCEMLRK